MAQLKGMKRDDLNALAEEQGVENPASLPNIAAVIDAIEATGYEDEPEDMDTGATEPTDDDNPGATGFDTGDRIVYGGGLMGTVLSFDDTEVVVREDGTNRKVRIQRGDID